MTKTFYNTINVKGEQLSLYQAKNSKQENEILAIFKEYKEQSFTPFEIHTISNMYDVPLTSIRRAITNLTKKGRLVKTSEQSEGLYGKLNYKWKFNY